MALGFDVTTCKWAWLNRHNVTVRQKTNKGLFVGRNTHCLVAIMNAPVLDVMGLTGVQCYANWVSSSSSKVFPSTGS
jgi:hypothetical protein